MNKEFREIIDDLVYGINAIQETYSFNRELDSDFEQASAKEWRKKEACCWLHGGTELRETVELEQWLYYYPEGTKTAHSLASIHYSEWSDYVEEGGKDGDNKYLDFRPGDLIEPETDETLLGYIQKLANLVEEKGWGNKKEKRALRAFLDYLRVYYKQEDIAFIEHIFPEKTDLHHGRIIRLIWPQSYPISQEVAASIVRELAYKCAYGRPNAQLNAAEALGLSWLSLIASRIRLPRTLEMVHGISSEDLLLDGDYPELLVPSIFGKQKTRISSRVARFLQALIRVPSAIPRKTILQKSLRDLRSPLNDAISKANPPTALGEITFLTFLSTPHHFGEQIRYIPKVSQNQ